MFASYIDENRGKKRRAKRREKKRERRFKLESLSRKKKKTSSTFFFARRSPPPSLSTSFLLVLLLLFFHHHHTPTDRTDTMLSIHRTPSDPRKGRAKRVIAILALAAAAGAARAQQTPPPPTALPATAAVGQAIADRLAGLAAPPLASLATEAGIVIDEVKLLPCTTADVAGEFERMFRSGVLLMQALPCEPWVKMTIANGYGSGKGAKGAAAAAGAGAPNAIAFSLTPEEADALRSAGVASGQAVSLNDLVSEVAVGARTPGFGGALARLLRRTSANLGAARDGLLSSVTGSASLGTQAGRLGADAGLLDGGRAFPARARYAPLSLSPGGGGAGGDGGVGVESLAPDGAIALLTAAEPGNGPVPANKGGVPTSPVSIDTTNGGKGGNGGTGGLLSVSGSGKLSAAAAETPAVRAPVGGTPSQPAVVVNSGVAVQGLVAEQPQLIGR